MISPAIDGMENNQLVNATLQCFVGELCEFKEMDYRED